MSVVVHQCHAKGCKGLVLSMNHGTEHLRRHDAEDLLRTLEIELHGEDMARAMGGE